MLCLVKVHAEITRESSIEITRWIFWTIAVGKCTPASIEIFDSTEKIGHESYRFCQVSVKVRKISDLRSSYSDAISSMPQLINTCPLLKSRINDGCPVYSVSENGQWVHDNISYLCRYIILCCTGFFPPPIYMGAIINSSCVYWQHTCGERGSCWLYDIITYRYAFFGTITLIQFSGIICYLATYYTLRRKEVSGK